MKRIRARSRTHRGGGAAAYSSSSLIVLVVGSSVYGDPVKEAEQARIEMIARVSPAVVCVNDAAQRGGGSGVLIHEEGYGLTNYHVVAGMLDKRRGLGGLPDGKQYELEVLGIDPTGDVAMFRLTGAEKFPFARLGDSEAVRAGDVVFAMGNPFSLSEDNTPSVSMGIVSGTNRYQYGVRGNLAYTDCIQVDAAINPGNSGGPLFNEAGEIIGINGRISVSSRGRYNVGHGYAISSNQVRRFIPALRAGLLGRHGTLGATPDEREPRNVLLGRIAPGGAADRAGIQPGERLVSFDGVEIVSGNQFASLLGTYPADWPVRLEVESGEARRVVEIRLDPIQPRLGKPYLVPREVNLREVKRVLRDFRRAVLRDSSASAPRTWRWTATREFECAGGEAREDETYDVRFEGAGPIEMTQRRGGGQTGSIIRYDEDSAVSLLTPEGEPMDVATGEAIALGSLYVLQKRMLSVPTEDELRTASHAGGDAPIVDMGARELSDDAVAVLAKLRRIRPALEVIHWPMGERAVARFLFDPETGRAVRVNVRDVPTGVEATVDFMDYEWVGGIVWPTTVRVRHAGGAYQETRTDWKLEP